MENKNYMHEWQDLFLKNRSYLISFTFRMTGSLSEAEDIVQDVFIECSRTNPLEIQNHKAWLTKICSNRSLDLLKSAFKKREVYPGVWLPDAIPDSLSIDDGIQNPESLTTSSLLLIQKLSPEERVIYVLNEVFEYTFKEISEILSKSEDACKKTAQRARKSFESMKKFNSYNADGLKLVTDFFNVAKSGDSSALSEYLSGDSEFWADGGGKVPVASKEVISDLDRISKFIAAVWSSRLLNGDEVKQEFRMVNERPGLVVSKRNPDGNWVFETIISCEIYNGKIVRIYAQRSPDKLEKVLMLHN